MINLFIGILIALMAIIVVRGVLEYTLMRRIDRLYHRLGYFRIGTQADSDDLTEDDEPMALAQFEDEVAAEKPGDAVFFPEPTAEDYEKYQESKKPHAGILEKIGKLFKG